MSSTKSAIFSLVVLFLDQKGLKLGLVYLSWFLSLGNTLKKGLLAWDTTCNNTVIDYPFLAFETADMVRMADMSSTVGYQDRFECHLAYI